MGSFSPPPCLALPPNRPRFREVPPAMCRFFFFPVCSADAFNSCFSRHPNLCSRLKRCVREVKAAACLLFPQGGFSVASSEDLWGSFHPGGFPEFNASSLGSFPPLFPFSASDPFSKVGRLFPYSSLCPSELFLGLVRIRACPRGFLPLFSLIPLEKISPDLIRLPGLGTSFAEETLFDFL